MRTLRARVFGRNYIVSEPDGGAFGTTLLGIHVPLVVAREIGATLVLLLPRQRLNDFVFQIVDIEVRVVRVRWPLSAFAGGFLRLREAILARMRVGSPSVAWPPKIQLAEVTRQGWRWAWMRRPHLPIDAWTASRDAKRRDALTHQLQQLPPEASPKDRLELKRQLGLLRKRNKIRKRHAGLVRKQGMAFERATGRLKKEWRQRRRRQSDLEKRRRELVKKLQVSFGYDVRRLVADRPTHARLRPRLEARSRQLARRHGIEPDARIVTLHVREAGYRPKFTGHRERTIDGNRTAVIEDYAPAIAELVARGFTVVRIGDPTMQPFARDDVIDLATVPGHDSQLLQLHCLTRSHFFLASESGPSELGLLFGVPMLQVNVINFHNHNNYPVRSFDRFIMKLALVEDSDRVYALEEMVQEAFIYDKNRRVAHDYIDNTTDDLRQAVLEMIDQLEHPRPPSPQQEEFASLLDTLNRHPRNRRKSEATLGMADIFLGAGYICHFFAERYLRAAPEVEATVRRDV